LFDKYNEAVDIYYIKWVMSEWKAEYETASFIGNQIKVIDLVDLGL